MGFKELQKINDAMLAKQVWQLLDNKDSLFHRFFKAKFFSHRIILDAKEGNGSYAWKSILKGRDVIRKEMQRKVGNGSRICIYQDNWLLNPHLKQILSPRDFLDSEARVSVLIDGERRYWIHELIDNLFLPHEAALIKYIPLSSEECNDKVYWPLNFSGDYSIKSRYRLLME